MTAAAAVILVAMSGDLFLLPLESEIFCQVHSEIYEYHEGRTAGRQVVFLLESLVPAVEMRSWFGWCELLCALIQTQAFQHT